MARSIIDDGSMICFLCMRNNPAHTHHVFHGTANRKLADEDGLTVRLCADCHRSVHRLHDVDEALKELGQWKWMKHYGKSVDEFIKRYGKNYIKESLMEVV